MCSPAVTGPRPWSEKGSVSKAAEDISSSLPFVIALLWFMVCMCVCVCVCVCVLHTGVCIG
jgi:hypothetical protein